MPYEIRKYDGSVLLTLGDGLTDNVSSSLTFIGKNVSNFGKLQNENFLHLLENFNGNIEPSNKVTGQLWYNSSQYKLSYYNGGRWNPVAVIDTTASQPTSAVVGNFWYDTVNRQLYINTGTSGVSYMLIGPESILGFQTTRLVSTKLKASGGADKPVIELVVDGEIVGILTKESFALDTVVNPISGLNNLVRGLNLKNPSSNDFIVNGRSQFSNFAVTATNLSAGTSGAIAYQTAPNATSFIPIGTNNQILFSNGANPEWRNLTEISVANATTSSNLLGGSVGSIPYQTANGVTTMLPLASEGFVLSTGATRPVWKQITSLAAGAAEKADKLLSSTDSNSFLYAATGAIASTIVERDNQANIAANILFANSASITQLSPLASASISTGFFNNISVVNTVTSNNISAPGGLLSSTATILGSWTARGNWVISGTWSLSTGSTLQATYADLAEKYIADSDYDIGTVVMVGGTKEITLAIEGSRPIGVISQNPAYLMNSTLQNGAVVALKGRVPVKVIGPVTKGDELIATNNGLACAGSNNKVFAISLENNDTCDVKLIEAVIL